MTNIRAQQLAWIGSILRETGWTPTELARRGREKSASLHQTTITNFLYDKLDKRTLSARTVAAISEATGWPPYEPATASNRQLPVLAGDLDILPGEGAVLRDDVDAALRSMIAGRNSAYAARVRNRALENAGFLPDDYVVVDLNEGARRGDVVTAQVYEGTIGDLPRRAETVMRIFEPPYLIAATTDASLRRPYYVDQERVVIRGVVIGLFRPRLAA